jgi:hypothetical protein
LNKGSEQGRSLGKYFSSFSERRFPAARRAPASTSLNIPIPVFSPVPVYVFLACCYDLRIYKRKG